MTHPANPHLMPDDRDDDGTVYLVVDRTPDGAYFPTVVIGDRAWALEDPAAYATALLTASEVACHDSAVLRLFVDQLGVVAEAAAVFLADMRKDRPPLDDTATKPLTFHPIVSTKPPHLPWIGVWLDGEQIGQWTPKAAREHAMWAVTMPVCAELDRQLAATARSGFGLELDAAGALVGDVLAHRLDDHDGTA